MSGNAARWPSGMGYAGRIAGKWNRFWRWPCSKACWIPRWSVCGWSTCNTLARMVETAGFSDVVSYTKELPPGWQLPPPPPPQPTTDQLLAQVEQLKVQQEAADVVTPRNTRYLDRDKMVLEDQRSRKEAARPPA